MGGYITHTCTHRTHHIGMEFDLHKFSLFPSGPGRHPDSSGPLVVFTVLLDHHTKQQQLCKTTKSQYLVARAKPQYLVARDEGGKTTLLVARDEGGKATLSGC